MKQNKFELKQDGSIERVGPFGSYGPIVEAKTKTEAQAKFLEYAYRSLEHTPRVKVSNGAYQVAYESLSYGITVESGIEGRKLPLCLSGEKDWSSVTDKTASFDYYASVERRMNMAA